MRLDRPLAITNANIPRKIKINRKRKLYRKNILKYIKNILK